MRLVTFWEVKPGMVVTVTQNFISGTVITTSGEVTYAHDEYIMVKDSHRLNVHPYAGMPNVEIWSIDESN